VDRNGIIEDGTELFGNRTPPGGVPQLPYHGFIALARFDQIAQGGNNDGLISVADTVFQDLLIWVDANHDGTSDPEELMTLEGAGVLSIDLSFRETRRRDRFGNLFRYSAAVQSAAQGSKTAWDVVLLAGPK